MLQAVGVFLLGALITASGVLVATMYDIGIVVMLIGVVGIVVRGVDLLSRLRL